MLKPAVDLVCDPHYLNCKLHGWLTYKEHMVAKANRKYLYAATYEDFMEMIEQCEDIEQLKHIRFVHPTYHPIQGGYVFVGISLLVC